MSSAPDVNDLHRAGKLPTNPMQGKPINGRRSPKFEAVPEPPPGMFEDEEPGLVAHPAAERAAAPDAPPQPPNWRSASERALGLGERLVRLPTGVASIDDATRGGPATKKRVVIVGAPGAGKTGLVTQFAVKCLLSGVHVGIIAADESADDLLIRIGQQLGFDRTILESPDHPYHEEMKAALADRVAGLPLLLVDGEDEPTPFVEAVARELRRRAGEGPALLVLDSIQRVRALAAEGADGPRERTDGVVSAMKLCSSMGHLVVATSEAARGFYGNRMMRTDGLAAGKESGSIEYAATVQITLASVKGETDLVDAEIVKNRMGKRVSGFRLKWSFERATFEEVEVDDLGGEDPKASARVAAARARVLRFVRSNPGENKRDVQQKAGGNGQDNARALEALIEEGAVRVENKGRGYAYFPGIVDVPADDLLADQGGDS